MDEYPQSSKLDLEGMVQGLIQDKWLVGGSSFLVMLLWGYIGLFEIHEVVARTKHYNGGISDESGESRNHIFS